MLEVTQEMMDHLARGRMLRKLEEAFLRDVPDFANLAQADRALFLDQGIPEKKAEELLLNHPINQSHAPRHTLDGIIHCFFGVGKPRGLIGNRSTQHLYRLSTSLLPTP